MSSASYFLTNPFYEFAGPPGQRLPEQIQMEKTQTSLGPDFPGFHVGCDAGNAGKFQAETDSACVRVGQCVRRRGAREMWDSVAVESTAQQDGTLVVRVIVFNPDWDEPLQIASIRSRPNDPDSLTALGCNLDHVSL